MRYRQEQLSETIAHELSDLIRTRMQDPRLGFVSVTSVDLSADLRHAKVYISVLGDEHAQKDSMKALEHGVGFLRHELAQRMQIRYTPEIMFKLDHSIAEGAHILQLIREVNHESSDSNDIAETVEE